MLKVYLNLQLLLTSHSTPTKLSTSSCAATSTTAASHLLEISTILESARSSIKLIASAATSAEVCGKKYRNTPLVLTDLTCHQYSIFNQPLFLCRELTTSLSISEIGCDMRLGISCWLLRLLYCGSAEIFNIVKTSIKFIMKSQLTLSRSTSTSASI